MTRLPLYYEHEREKMGSYVTEFQSHLFHRFLRNPHLPPSIALVALHAFLTCPRCVLPVIIRSLWPYLLALEMKPNFYHPTPIQR